MPRVTFRYLHGVNRNSATTKYFVNLKYDSEMIVEREKMKTETKIAVMIPRPPQLRLGYFRGQNFGKQHFGAKVVMAKTLTAKFWGQCFRRLVSED